MRNTRQFHWPIPTPASSPTIYGVLLHPFGNPVFSSLAAQLDCVIAAPPTEYEAVSEQPSPAMNSRRRLHATDRAMRAHKKTPGALRSTGRAA